MIIKRLLMTCALLTAMPSFGMSVPGAFAVNDAYDDAYQEAPRTNTYEREQNLIDAVATNNFALVQRTIASGADPDYVGTPSSTINVNVACRNTTASVLWFAVQRNSLETTRCLVENNASTNNITCQNMNKSLLWFAAQRGSVGITRYLLENGVSPYVDGFTDSNHPLSVAIKNRKLNETNQNLIDAAATNNIALVKVAIANGADVNHKGRPSSANNVDVSCQNIDRTALLCAAQNGSMQIAALLLENDADPNLGILTNDGTHTSTPLLVAAKNKKHNVVQHLIEHGAQPTATDTLGKSALDYIDDPAFKAKLKSAIRTYQTKLFAKYFFGIAAVCSLVYGLYRWYKGPEMKDKQPDDDNIEEETSTDQPESDNRRKRS